MTLVGKASYVNRNEEIVTTLHVLDEFDDYAKDSSQGKFALGQAVDTIYVGTIDVSEIPIGVEIDVVYAKAVQTKNGFYQPVKDVIVL